MDLPTYTNIWRIEKRLYKLYDLRLPMPLPLVQIGVFGGVFVPWILLLRFAGIPFESPWHVLYIVPPGVLTWMATRPVIEGKRLTELLISQSRYLAEPRTWCRLTPIREPREVVVVARVWRRPQAAAPIVAPERAALKSRRKTRKRRPVVEEAPVLRPAFVPSPAVASAPQPLAEVAVHREEPGTLGTEDDVRVAGPPIKPWRRTTRDISHEEEAPVLECPPATPQLELTTPGKRAFASGVRRPGSTPELWKSATPAEGAPDTAAGPPGIPVPNGDGTPDQSTPKVDPTPVTGAPQAPQADAPLDGASGGDQVPGPGVSDAEGAPAAAADDGSAASAHGAGEWDAAYVSNGDGAASGASSAPVTRPDIPLQQVPPAEGAAPQTRPQVPEGERAKPTRPDIPMVPGTFGREAQPEEEAPRREPPKPWSDGLSKPSRAATTDALVWPPVPAPRSERREGGDRPEERWPAQGTPAKPERPAAGHPGRLPAPGPPPVQEEPSPAPSREVRSGPASPVRPRPLPPPPPAPPSEPAITPPGPEHEVSSGGLRRLIQAVGGGHGEADAEYQQRLQQPFQGTRHIVVLGCTGGAGQTVTGLMLGHTFAQHNGEPIVAIDVNPGPGALARRTRSETNETLTGLITRADQIGSLTAMRRYTSQAKSGLEVIAAGKNPLQALDDRDYALAIRTLDRFYSITLLDAAAAVVARVLPYADQIVLVAPASADAPRAVAMTFEWLDGHGYEELRTRAVTVINGVSRRSMDDVEQAEAVARGRCRALVRIPWDDHLSMDRAPRNELKSLRAPTRRAYVALAGVVAGGFTVVPERYQDIQQEQEATR